VTESRILLTARGVRAFADGFTAILLPVYLAGLGFSPFRVGVLTTATLLGSASLTLAVGLAGHHQPARRLLLAASWLMAGTGLAFSQAHGFWPLTIIGFVGTLNPSGGDVSPFLPLEQAMLAHAVTPSQRTAVFARYGLTAALAGAAGALSVGLVGPIAGAAALPRLTVIEGAFGLYGAIGILAFLLYLRLPKEPVDAAPVRAPLGPSRAKVFQLAALFSLDSFGSGFIVQSLFALWLLQRFGVSLATIGQFFFATSLLTAVSQLAAPPLARRIGLIPTMVFTHVPASLCVIAAAFAPNVQAAFALLFVRALLSNMDVPARQSYVMAVVTPAERTAAASVTNVPRSLASALSPALSGYLFGAFAFAWPLVIGPGIKIAYDLLLWRMFAAVKPPEEGHS
jgi:MFS family permease